MKNQALNHTDTLTSHIGHIRTSLSLSLSLISPPPPRPFRALRQGQQNNNSLYETI